MTITYTLNDLRDAMFTENIRRLAEAQGLTALAVLHEIRADEIEAGRARLERGEQVLLNTRVAHSARTTNLDELPIWDGEVVSEVLTRDSGEILGRKAFERVALVTR